MDRIKKGEANSGNMDIHIPEEESLADQFLFREYLMRYMGNYGAENAEGALLYQLEYLIAGKENDTENLRGVANRLLALREAANALYLFSDSEKKHGGGAGGRGDCHIAGSTGNHRAFEGILIAWLGIRRKSL